MRYRIRISPAARQDIRSLPGHVRAQATQLIDELARDPRPSRAKELRERENIFRIWLAGRWRIAYEVDDEMMVVSVMRVRRKEDIDYSNL